MAAGFVLLMAISAFLFVPIELSDRLFFGTAMLAISSVLAFVARKIYVRFVCQHED
jgi:hypothetical protein